MTNWRHLLYGISLFIALRASKFFPKLMVLSLPGRRKEFCVGTLFLDVHRPDRKSLRRNKNECTLLTFVMPAFYCCTLENLRDV